jgi:hypothetical protein
VNEQGKYKATMYLAIWQGNFIGTAFGGWLFTSSGTDGAIKAALAVFAWLGATHYVWNRARRVFWPEDAGKF